MKVEHTGGWRFEPRLKSDNDLIKCPYCDKYSPLHLWTEGFAYCEDCGDHSSMICPNCEEHHDNVYSKPFEVIHAE